MPTEDTGALTHDGGAAPQAKLNHLDTDMEARDHGTLRLPDCAKPAQTERRYHQGETQGFCATCALWVFEKDIYACPKGDRDLITEAKAHWAARGRKRK